MSMWVIPYFLSAGGALLLGGILFSKKANSPVFLPMISIMVVVAWIHGLNAMGVLFPEYLSHCEKINFNWRIILPCCTWLYELYVASKFLS